jgi:beta-glucosidase
MLNLMLQKFGDRVSNWMVLNEPLVFTGAGYFLGIHAPGKKGMNSFLSAAHHASLAQAVGIRQIKEHNTSI